MKVKPNRSYRLAGFTHGLIKGRIYNAIVASNIPDYKLRGFIFVKDILLDNTEYTIVK